MKPKDLDIVQWKDLMIAAAGELKRDPIAPIAMRCENTPLTVGWKAGGFTFSGGYQYKSFCPRAVHGPCAMLAVRDDFLRWTEKFLKEQAKEQKKSDTMVEQPTLI